MPGEKIFYLWESARYFHISLFARFLARKAGLAGKDDLEEARADMVVEHCWNLVDGN